MQFPRIAWLGLLPWIASTAACTTDSKNELTEVGGSDTAGDSSESGDTGNSSESGDTGNSSESSDTGDSSESDATGNSGESSDTTDGVELTCVSGSFWTDGDHGSSRMHPGRDCLGCHQSMDEAAKVVMAGTVYTDSHELDDCNGVEGVDVLITDANGTDFQTTTNSAGNFVFKQIELVPPYAATLTWEGRTREMVNMQTLASCNACHTELGSQGAPGRILAP